MIGVIIAMETEVKNLTKTRLVNPFIHMHNKQKFYVSNIQDTLCVVAFSGIGKVNAAATAMNMINTFNVQYIINVGAAAGLKENLNNLDVIIADQLKYYDVDVSAFGYELNQVPKMPVTFPTHKKMSGIITDICRSKNLNVEHGTVISGDTFINQKNLKNYPAISEPEVLALDMEATAIAQVCFSANVKFACFKIISDNLFSDKSNEAQFEINLKYVASIVDDVVVEIIKKIIYIMILKR